MSLIAIKLLLFESEGGAGQYLRGKAEMLKTKGCMDTKVSAHPMFFEPSLRVAGCVCNLCA